MNKSFNVKTEPVCKCDEDCSCTPLTLARYDIWEWNRDNNYKLPGGYGSVTKHELNHVITIKWNDNRSTEKSDTFFSFEFRP